MKRKLEPGSSAAAVEQDPSPKELTAEQKQRIDSNRQAALERLLSKRKNANISTSVSNPKNAVKSEESPESEESAKPMPPIVAQVEKIQSKKEEIDLDMKRSADDCIVVNRAPVLTMWTAVVAQNVGHTFAAGLTFGRAITSLFAESKRKRLGIGANSTETEEKMHVATKASSQLFVEVMGRKLRVGKLKDGTVAAADQMRTISSEEVGKYVNRMFGGADKAHKARMAMDKLAAVLPEDVLQKKAYSLYEQFRPDVADGVQGWGQKGVLDLCKLERLREELVATTRLPTQQE